MKSMEEWNRCLDLLLSGALQDLHTTQEYEYRKNRREYIDKMLDADLTRDQKTPLTRFYLSWNRTQSVKHSRCTDRGLGIVS